MPHLIVEYTENLGRAAKMAQLLAKANELLIGLEEDGKKLYPIGGVRSRAVMLNEYCVADGTVDAAFVHVTLKIGRGRSEAAKERTAAALFEMVKAHFAAEFQRRGLALSLEIVEFSEAGTKKQNNLHSHFNSH